MDHTARRGFICAGCWTLDRVKLIDTWPQEESLAMIGEIDRQGGGSAHNVGIGLKRIDAALPVESIGLLGTDADGDFLLRTCSRVRHRYSPDASHRQGCKFFHRCDDGTGLWPTHILPPHWHQRFADPGSFRFFGNLGAMHAPWLAWGTRHPG